MTACGVVWFFLLLSKQSLLRNDLRNRKRRGMKKRTALPLLLFLNSHFSFVSKLELNSQLGFTTAW